MQNKRETAGVSKERIFSIIRKALEEGITDGRRWLWIDFKPNVVAVRDEDGYVVMLWREGVLVKLFLDFDFNVIGNHIAIFCPHLCSTGVPPRQNP